MSARMFSKWITCTRPRTGARLRLFCLPCAGSGASVYRVWSAGLPSWVEVCPIQLPGREDRYNEPAFTSLTGLSRAVAREILPFLDTPFVIFGHSMGALLAFELTRALRRSGAPAPLALYLAAYPAPQVPLLRAPIHHLPDGEFIAEIRRMQGTPEAVLQHADLMAFMLPTLRADFEACDTYTCTDEPPLDLPLVLYGGADDRDVPATALDEWRHVSTGTFTRRLLPGTHFFVQSHRDLLLADLAGRLAALPL